MALYIVGGTLLTPHQKLADHTVVIAGGEITSILPASDSPPATGRVINAEGLWVVPGFIDVHVHGAAGFDAMDATPEALHRMAAYFARHGVTGYLPTTMSASAEAVLAAAQNVADARQPPAGARHLGVHLEGPYLNPEHGGAQPGEVLRDPNPGEYGAWFATGAVRLVTLAVERPGSEGLIRYALERGAELAVGHSGAGYEEVCAAADLGLRQATHTFNGMSELHHRRPGILGAVLTDDRIYAQVIVDLIHVHPAVVKLIVRAKGVERTILITDAMRATGLADGEYDLGQQTITVRDGVARTAAGHLAGSTLTMDRALRHVMHAAGLSLQEALPMATAVPAEALGMAEKKGVLAAGADADVVLLEQDLTVRRTMVAGKTVFKAF